MERINGIRTNPIYIECYEKTRQAELGREFCCHQMEHLLDVARISYIHNLEEQLGIDKEVIYAAALLHDIGKFRQYEDGTPHEMAGVEIAREILDGLPGAQAFSVEEKALILDAIASHRRAGEQGSILAEILYRSDKESRCCFACKAETACNWSREKKNMEILV